MAEPARLGTLPRVGDRIDRYEVVAEIAHGGMAAVYAVRRTSIGGFDKLLAMKVLLPHLQNEKQFVDMFLDEARIGSKIQHPNVVGLFDLGEHDGSPFMVMDYLRGQSLSRVVKKARKTSTRLPLGFFCRIMAQTAEGLHGAHEARGSDGELLSVVHRDVSPQNIHIGYDGQVKVVDFGIAAARGRISSTRSGELKGKFTYLAPEQIDRAGELDRRVDIWAFGVVAWELFAGRRLFKADDDGRRLWKILNMEIPPLSEVAPGVPGGLATLVMGCLNRNPKQRPSDCQVLAQEFGKVARQLGSDTAGDISREVRALFASEKAVEEERLSAAQRKGPAPPLIDEPTSEPSVQTQTEGRPGNPAILLGDDELGRRPSRTPVLMALCAAGVAVGLIAFVAFGRGGGEASPEPGGRRTGGGPACAARACAGGGRGHGRGLPEEAAVETVRIGVSVDPEARLVLVGGERRRDNPLRLELLPDQTVEVELVSPSGGIQRYEVTAADDGQTLELAEEAAEEVAEAPGRRPRDRAAGRTAMGSAMMGTGMRALLNNPY